MKKFIENIKNYLTNNRKYDNINITEKDRQWDEANKGIGGKYKTHKWYK